MNVAIYARVSSESQEQRGTIGSQVELLRARLAFLEGDRTSATRSVLTVVGEEPENVQAWLLLAEVANDNKRFADRALINVVRLDPRG